MSKKKFKKLAKANIQILKSGKIKLSKDEKIDISTFVSTSIDKTIVSRLDAIISKEDVNIDDKSKTFIVSNLLNPITVTDLSSKSGDANTKTLVIPITKKSALDIFDYLSCGELGVILRTSTLAPIYKKVKDKWKELNDDNSSFTNVLYVPDVMVFIDYKTGDIKKSPYKINVLLVSIPSLDKMTDGIEKITTDDAISRVITDMMEAAIRCGCKDLIIDPFSHKILKKDLHKSSVLWDTMNSSKKLNDNVKTITYCIDDEDKFIIFNNNLSLL